jgi:rhodanese-related sulfurtransferase
MGDFLNIDAMQLQQMQAEGELLLIDVRTDQEVARGVIPGARHIPLQQLAGRHGEIGREKPVVFYCQTGARSAQASYFLASQGWERVHNLQGGIVGWAGRGMPIADLA